jgi:hypothetical protein
VLSTRLRGRGGEAERGRASDYEDGELGHGFASLQSSVRKSATRFQVSCKHVTDPPRTVTQANNTGGFIRFPGDP